MPMPMPMPMPRLHSSLLPVVRAALAVGVAAAPVAAEAQTPAPARWPWAPVAAAARADTAALRRTLDGIAARHRGVVGYAVWNLDTGERLERRGDEPFPTASLVKVPVLVSLLRQVEAGTVSLADPVSLSAIDQVPGSGILRHFLPGAILHVGDVARLMIVISDNTATNLVLDKVGLRQVGADMEALGLPRTKVWHKVYKRDVASIAPDSSLRYGLGVTTPNEMARLYARLADGTAVSPRADSLALAIMDQTEDLELLQRFAGGIRAAHKTGWVDAARTECTLWPLRGRVVACVFTKENADERYDVDAEANVTIARMGEAIVKAWAPPKAPAAPLTR